MQEERQPMKRIFTSITLSVLVAAAMANPLFVGVFKTKYNVAASSALAKAKCQLCHSTGKKLNSYGADLYKVMGESKKLTPEMLAKIEGLDSNKNGVKNIDEIKADKLPGK
jgi:hypothetical protein